MACNCEARNILWVPAVGVVMSWKLTCTWVCQYSEAFGGFLQGNSVYLAVVGSCQEASSCQVIITIIRLLTPNGPLV